MKPRQSSLTQVAQEAIDPWLVMLCRSRRTCGAAAKFIILTHSHSYQQTLEQQKLTTTLAKRAIVIF